MGLLGCSKYVEVIDLLQLFSWLYGCFEVGKLPDKKNVSLNQNRSFRYVYNKGRSLVSPLVVTYVLKNRCGINRVGITASKKIGNAVKRNRARRVIKAAYEICKNDVKTGYDIVFIARVKTADSKSNDIYFFMSKHLAQLGLLGKK